MKLADFNTTPAVLNRLCRLSTLSSLRAAHTIEVARFGAREDIFIMKRLYWHLAYQLHGVTTCQPASGSA